MSHSLALSDAATSLQSRLKNKSLFAESGFIGGKHVRSESGKTFPVYNPADGSLLGNCPDFTLAELKTAVAESEAAFNKWRHSTPLQRSKVLQKWRELCEANIEDLALLITLENGKPLTEARGEVAYANSFLDWFSGEAMRMYGDFIPSPNPVTRTVVIRQPVGVCAMITPWNFPIAMLAKKTSPALAFGCATVTKPPAETPFSIVAYAALASEAGLPPGLLNVVPTLANVKEFGLELCTSDTIKKVSFTGSTPVGRHLQKLCASADRIHKLTLELGGNAPFIVFNDADLETAVAGYMAGKFRANGENCVAPNRTLVQSGILPDFVKLLKQNMEAFVVGPGDKEGVTNGALIHQTQRDKVKGIVDDLVAKGATVVTGGKIPEHLPKEGAFYEPTIVTGVTRDMKSWTNEMFGPVAAITSFETEKEALELANDTDMGLACYVFTKDYARCWRMGEELSYGMVGLNSGMVSSAEAPFGGKNNSGTGREGSKYAIHDFTEIKLMAWGGIEGAPLY